MGIDFVTSIMKPNFCLMLVLRGDLAFFPPEPVCCCKQYKEDFLSLNSELSGLPDSRHCVNEMGSDYSHRSSQMPGNIVVA